MILESIHLRAAAGPIRVEEYDGRDHLMLPVVALIGDQIIHAVNAVAAERVPIATLAEAAETFNQKPVVFGHPVKNGKHVSACSPEVLSSHGIGTILNSRMAGPRLLMDIAIDPVRAEIIGGVKFVEDLRANAPCDVSVGVNVACDNKPGELNGKRYAASWIKTHGDHLAVLHRGRGACSWEAGCGIRAAMHHITDDGIEIEEDDMTDDTLGKRVLTAIMTALGKPADDKLLAAKTKDCPMCQGSGSKDGNPCDACEGSGELKVAAEGDTDMGKKALIDKLVACKCSEYDKDDVTALEGFSEPRLTVLADMADARAKEKEAEDEAKRKTQAKTDAEDAAKKKEADDKRSLEQKITALEAELRTAESKQLTEEEFNKRAPDSIRAIVADKRAADAAEVATLVTSLKAASSAFTEDELKAKPLVELRKLAAFAKIDAPVADYSGRGLPLVRAAADATDYNPPNPYEAGLKALQAKH